MSSRMDNPAAIVPDMGQALQMLGNALFSSAAQTGVPKGLLFLCYLRASQINGDSVCVQLHARNALSAGETTERVLAAAAWRDTQLFNEAERAALALCEAITRIEDRAHPVPDDIYDEAAAHFGQQALATLIAGLATVNLYNRLNVATGQLAVSADTSKPGQ
ncbi:MULTISPECIES: carboxymuconolactone decarboxylase family protein [Paenibacillus]|uniref:Alkylhydroperoxidase n=1 Tax=Paenibacillus campinasensis TaxID=66347 RepID=A0A268F1Y8_9BACL|nr:MULTISPECIES: carboxymuconolactone decarboxylase family protein [Paenibacillus]MUG65862.1 carboxymuconolactone decarboxylase family protein [Paenibacillus campinasensis]PAD79398.1 alkylhydroperoxidase [Paenibacillus campinasensis]PAK51659.1 alkylhydroperoxidase [Paenibacillus sp. 7541]